MRFADRWEHIGQAKICVKCPTESELYEIQARAQAAGLVNYLVVSVGRMFIEPLAMKFTIVGMAMGGGPIGRSGYQAADAGMNRRAGVRSKDVCAGLVGSC